MGRNIISSRVALLCLFLAGHLTSLCQELTEEDSVLSTPRVRYLTLGLGTYSVQLNDQHMSPLNYLGGSAYLQFGVFKRKKRTLRNFTFGGTYGTIGAKRDDREIDPTGKYIRIDMSYAQQHYLRSILNDRVRWYVGGKIKSQSNVRLNEQLDGGFITFLFANGVYLSSVAEREIAISSRPLTLSWQVDLPIVNHVIRPNFLNIFDFVNPENNWFRERVDDSNWLAINRYSNIISTVTLLYPIQSTNVLRFSYEWDFYRISKGLEATSATHTFMFSFLFNF